MLKKSLLLMAASLVLVNVLYVRSMSNPPPNFAAEHGGKVILYATSWCGYCAKTRQLLNKNNVGYVEYDIESSKEGMKQYKALGGKGVPVLLVQGEVIQGYNPKRILQLINSPENQSP